METPSAESVFKIIELAKDESEVMERLQLSLIGLQCARLGDVLSHEVDVRDVVELYENLNYVHQTRLLLSAEMGEWLASSEKDRYLDKPYNPIAGLRDMLIREHIAQGALSGTLSGQFGDFEKVWSPIGDYLICKDDDSFKIYEAEHVDASLFIDFESPMAMRQESTGGVLSQKRLPISAEEKVRIRGVLASGLDLIDRAVPCYGSLIRMFTHRVIVRKSLFSVSDAEPGTPVFASEQTARQTGSIRILNPHLPEFTSLMAAEMLLHESIHNYLTACEFVHGRFCSGSIVVRPVSPWSGNAIFTSAFVHAIFVYYACLTLMRRVKEQEMLGGGDNREVVDRMINHFLSGFLMIEPLSSMLMSEPDIDQSLLTRLDALQQAATHELKVLQCRCFHG